MEMDYVAGETLGFDKPLGWTSFDLVAKVRRALCLHLGVKKLKVGHAGTLDPLATGVLILCTGKATKRIPEIQASTKEYVATLRLGATTPSFDMETEVDMTYPGAEQISTERIREALESFIGETEQVPPEFSACKVDGHRAYKLAHRGERVELKAKTIRIDEAELLGIDRGTMDVTIRLSCSKGTYVRALARDLGRTLGSGAYLRALRRTRVGQVRVEQCMSLEEFVRMLGDTPASPGGKGGETIRDDTQYGI